MSGRVEVSVYASVEASYAAEDLPTVIPAKAGIHFDLALHGLRAGSARATAGSAQATAKWIPAFAGMTVRGARRRPQGRAGEAAPLRLPPAPGRARKTRRPRIR
ncbi:hypothetical protein LEN_3599 [Lysobacter enzymogenes]|uniref:Uncharacterized protein n=1 Tax=Lysobacter enzymogenes TaxID=69 RepID=A0AAU9B434_LYSEN|nr:hypothetical protein LEN_3599 [Lysobacter enzymogenes]